MRRSSCMVSNSCTKPACRTKARQALGGRARRRLWVADFRYVGNGCDADVFRRNLIDNPESAAWLLKPGKLLSGKRARRGNGARRGDRQRCRRSHRQILFALPSREPHSTLWIPRASAVRAASLSISGTLSTPVTRAAFNASANAVWPVPSPHRGSCCAPRTYGKLFQQHRKIVATRATVRAVRVLISIGCKMSARARTGLFIHSEFPVFSRAPNLRRGSPCSKAGTAGKIACRCVCAWSRTPDVAHVEPPSRLARCPL